MRNKKMFHAIQFSDENGILILLLFCSFIYRDSEFPLFFLLLLSLTISAQHISFKLMHKLFVTQCTKNSFKQEKKNVKKTQKLFCIKKHHTLFNNWGSHSTDVHSISKRFIQKCSLFAYSVLVATKKIELRTKTTETKQ